MSEYVVIYEQGDDEGWGAYIPDLPGVVALGSTRAEVTERIREALDAYVDDVRERGGSMPAPHHVADTVVT
ncbi:MAG TPA: type II toxin-antitoxin system HicB family antitoxin [Solirubrobacteraceae bacterium]|nr:type II toxin-antitoxin system HicB family antitoxin [Solirubrobacteraceae bacterium]